MNKSCQSSIYVVFLARFSMGCLLSCCFACKKPKIMVEYCIPSNAEFLIPHGKIIVGLDRKFRVPVIETNFFDYYKTSVRLWPKISTHSNYHFLLKAPISLSEDSIEEKYLGEVA